MQRARTTGYYTVSFVEKGQNEVNSGSPLGQRPEKGDVRLAIALAPDLRQQFPSRIPGGQLRAATAPTYQNALIPIRGRYPYCADAALRSIGRPCALPALGRALRAAARFAAPAARLPLAVAIRGFFAARLAATDSAATRAVKKK